MMEQNWTAFSFSPPLQDTEKEVRKLVDDAIAQAKVVSTIADLQF